MIHVYGGRNGWLCSPIQMLIDPSYNIKNSKISNQLKTICQKGWQVGVHTSYNSWDKPYLMREELEKIERTLGVSVTACRQHWLRFSFDKTWKCQQEAGILRDSTLGFNDRPGFRNGTALSFHPWDFDTGSPMFIKVTPLVLMDSHLYDYAHLSEDERLNQIRKWLHEIRFVHGSATVLWHPHTLSKDYGWRNGFLSLIKELKT